MINLPRSLSGSLNLSLILAENKNNIKIKAMANNIAPPFII